MQSAGSSPGIVRRPFCAETSVAAFKRVLEGPTPAEREQEERRRRELQGRAIRVFPRSKFVFLAHLVSLPTFSILNFQFPS